MWFGISSDLLICISILIKEDSIMAINIFQGGSNSRSKANSASNSTRAQATKGALVGPSEASDSGSTAVSSKNTLSKVGNFVGKAAGIASKFLPGIGGTVAKGIANLFNDPEWWQSVPGDAVSLNVPLTPAIEDPTQEAYAFRAVFAQALSCNYDDNEFVIQPSDQMITQYLMPEIRKVVNAIPLQTAESYKTVLQVQATIYALWRNLKRYDYMLKHGQTYVPNLNVSNYPVLQVDNAAWLQSTIGRLEEYLRANVRLPHTLCEYLAWRYGRIYKSTNSAKAGLMMYNVYTVEATIDTYNDHISTLMNAISSSDALQKANTDIYNAYYDHDLMVEIADDTQFKYDMKEFCLRTNLDTLLPSAFDEPNNLVYIDSNVDNPTTFMASTVSTRGRAPDGSYVVLFPVIAMDVFILWQPKITNPVNQTELTATQLEGLSPMVYADLGNNPSASAYSQFRANKWIRIAIASSVEDVNPNTAITMALAAKTMDIYNKNVFLPFHIGAQSVNYAFVGKVDLTSLSMDAGSVDDYVLGNEQVYAFANLVDVSRKHSMSYAKAEKLVAKDTANMIESLDVAALPSVTPSVAKK
jgi:hypothetical protein